MNLLPFILLTIVPYTVAVVLCASLFIWHLRSAQRRWGKDDEKSGQPPITIVICVADADARTCANNLPSITSTLGEEDRVIIEADHVSEASLTALRDAVATDTRCSLKENSGPKGKKHAQRMGVEAAETEAIVTIDADCRVSKKFADTVRDEIFRCKTDNYMLLLPVEMIGDGGLLGQLVEIEFGCLQVVTAGTATGGRPSMANGAGMAFARSLFMEHDAKKEYASGDDMFLLEHATKKGSEVRYICGRDAMVSTSAPATISAYLRQRTRWLAKAGGFRSPNVIILALIVFVAVMAWPVAIAGAALGAMTWGGAGLVFGIKLAVDSAACGAWLWFREGSRGLTRLWLAIPLEIIYPVMTITVAFRAAVASKSKW